MAEYIEREALLQDIGETVLFSVRGGVKLPTPEMRGANKVIDRIKSVPTADVVEVRHGRWINDGEDWFCNRCNHNALCDKMTGVQVASAICPNCGAKMDGKGEGE